MKRLALVVALAACGSKSSPATTTTTTPPPSGSAADGSAAAATPEPLPDVPFKQLDHAQRITFMKSKVMPAMEPIFKNRDAKKFAEFGCKTCHGEDGEQLKFKMPNEKLPKLDFKNMGKFKKEDLEWMGKEVKPTMAKLLGEPEHSESNPQGFGCLECHVQQE